MKPSMCATSGRRGRLRDERVRQLKRSLTAVHGIDDIFLDCFNLPGGQIALQKIHLRRAYERAGAAGHELDALRSRIGALVKLAGQVFGGKNRAVDLRQRFEYVVDLRLGKNSGNALFQHVGETPSTS